jgi:hypothetical protein
MEKPDNKSDKEFTDYLFSLLRYEWISLKELIQDKEKDKK